MAQKFPIRIISEQSFCPLVTLTCSGFLLKLIEKSNSSKMPFESWMDDFLGKITPHILNAVFMQKDSNQREPQAK